MSEHGTNFFGRIAAWLARGLRAARRPWVVVVGLLYLAGDLWCIAGGPDWRLSDVGRFIHLALLGEARSTNSVPYDEVFVVFPSSPTEHPRVVSANSESWDEMTSILKTSTDRVVIVSLMHAPWERHFYAPAIRTRMNRLRVQEFSGATELAEPRRSQALDVVREWNKACGQLGIDPIDINPKRFTKYLPLGILHNALSLGVLAITLNALPTVTIGAWLRRRAARRMARGQCVACGYEFGAATIERCPECGEARARGVGTDARA